MDYEKKYKEALEKAREWYNKIEPDSYTCVVESIFPELKESEDERIRKELITHCKNTRCVTEEGAERIAKWIAWLEKQGEKKSTDNLTQQEAMDIAVAKCFNEQDAVDKVEPKFHEGDWIITNKNHIWYVDETPETTSYLYRLINQYGKVEVAEFEIVDKKARLWTIQDAKELKKIPNALEECEIEHVEHGKYYYCIKDYYSGGCKRASKGEVVQALRGMSMMALGAEANKYFIPVKGIIDIKHAWNEEDKEMIDKIIDYMKPMPIFFESTKGESGEEYTKEFIENATDWLQSIKDKVEPQLKQQWSEEDKIIMSAISQLLKDCESENCWNCVYSNDREVFFADIEKWLKSLKDRFSIHQNNLNADDEINYRILQEIICNSDTSATLANKLSNWLQSFKNRVIPQSKNEWSEEDEENLTDTCIAIRKFYREINGAQELIDWLKSLKERVT